MMRQRVSGLTGWTGGRRLQQGEVQMFEVQWRRDADGGS